MSHEHMIVRIRKFFKVLLNDYITVPSLEEYLQNTSIANNGSATLGNFALALKELRTKNEENC